MSTEAGTAVLEREVTGDDLVNAIREVAEANPDFVYRAPSVHELCVYVDEGQPSCLVGHGLWNLGLINETFDNGEPYWAKDANPNYQSVCDVLDRLGLWDQMTEAQRVWVGVAQSTQDDSLSWGTSIRRADETVEGATNG